MPIFKVQRPLMTNDPRVPWLIYSKDRKHEGEVPDAEIDAEVRKAMRGDHKAYFEGRHLPDGRVELGRRVGEQVW